MLCSGGLIFLLISAVITPIWAVLTLEVDDLSGRYNYTVTDGTNVLFQSGSIAFYHENGWCVGGSTLEATDSRAVTGNEPGLGYYDGLEIHWMCHQSVPIVTTFKSFDASIVFETAWPLGASFSKTPDDPDSSLTNFPTLVSRLPQRVSWHGSFTQGIHDFSVGSKGGPVAFYDENDLDRIVVASPLLGSSFKSSTAGNNQDYQGKVGYYSPGTNGRIRSLPENFTQSIMLYQTAPESGMVGGLLEWGRVMQKASGLESRLPDILLQKVGYQTDNGAFYCFCEDDDCSNTLLDVMDSLRDVGIGYLSFQGAGASKGRGQAAPWCIETWGVDGGLGHQYPMNLTDFSKALGLPLQYYAPYFCPLSPYFSGHWNSVASNTSLPGCDRYDFQNVEPLQSKKFYGEFFDRGKAAGMYSFETDFMNQNYNCVPEFVETTDRADIWQQGMTQAAFERDIPIQWCYGAPTDVLASLQQPAVTNFRVSFDFAFGQSWNVGLSSLFVGALGLAPSKDTLWTTTNHHYTPKGYALEPDHEVPAIELHAVLALMTTGPVGISDAIGETDKTLLRRMVAKNGDLLQPSRAIVVTDSTFTNPGLRSEEAGYVYGTSAVGPSWVFVSFKLKATFQLGLQDFWPRLWSVTDNSSNSSKQIFYRFYSQKSVGDNQQEDLIHFTTASKHQSSGVITLPSSSFANVTGGTDFAPVITQVWTPCTTGGWTLLGEWDKYVPLSPVRFATVDCHEMGLTTSIRGTKGEVVTVAALDSGGNFLKKTVSFKTNGSMELSFDGSTLTSW